MSDGEFQRVDALAEYYMPENVKNVLKRANDFLKTKNMTGVEMIAQERLEQKTKHNKTIKSDWEQYPDFELAMFAEAVLTGDVEKIPHYVEEEYWAKICSKPYEERLVIAGALIAAEIDRLNFQE